MEKLFQNCQADRIHIKPHIPHKKAYNAITAYAYGMSYDDIVVLFDESMMGSGKSGIVITPNIIFFKEDLESSFHIKINEIQSIECKKSLLSKAVYINGKKVYSPTMADFQTTELIFSILATNLKNIQSLVLQTHQETKFENEEHSKQIEVSSNLLKSGGSDDLMQQLKVNKSFDTAASVIGFALSFATNINLMGENTSSEQVRKEVAKTIYKIVNNIRTRNIENRAVMELKNNFATFELLVFACILLSIELQRRGANEQLVEYLISEGLIELLGDAIYHRLGSFILDRIFETDDLREAQATFYVKILMNNIAQKIIFDFEEGIEYIMCPDVLSILIPNKHDIPNDEDEIFPYIVVSICNFMIKIMGDLSISSEARDCVDRLMDM